MLVLLTGLPCTGKSSVAKAIAQALPAAWLSADPIDAALIGAGLTVQQRPDVAGYEAMKALADLQLSAGLSVVIDAVNPFGFVRDAYFEIAAKHEARVAVVITECSDEAIHRMRVADRLKQEWAEVERQSAYFESYDGEAIRLDAVRFASLNERDAVAYVLGLRE